jgi:prolyl-tRNA synthetase
VIKRRDTGQKEIVPQSDAVRKLSATLETMQKDLYNKAKERLRQNTVVANSLNEVESILNDVTAEKGGGKFVMTHIKDDPKNDDQIKEFKASVRNIPLVDEFDGPGKCIVTGEPVERRAVIAKAY